MLAAERRARVVEHVDADGVVTTEGLAGALGVSVETIRRDLLTLEQQGALQRVHGGAMRTNRPVRAAEAPFEQRSAEASEGKRAIAAAAAAMIVDDSLVFIDVGTTAQLIARELAPDLRCTIVTASLRTAMELSEHPGIDLVVTGGRVRSGDLAVSSPKAQEFLQETFFDLAFLGSGGLDARRGLTDYYPEEVDWRRAVLQNARASYVLCDASKFDEVARHHVASLDQIDGVITDLPPQGELLAALTREGVTLITAGSATPP